VGLTVAPYASPGASGIRDQRTAPLLASHVLASHVLASRALAWAGSATAAPTRSTNSRTVASATRCNTARSSAAPSAPSGGRYTPTTASVVAGSPFEPGPAEFGPQPGDEGLQRVAGVAGCLVGPQLFGQRAGRRDTPGVQRQQN
jgi:hypothetical protein